MIHGEEVLEEKLYLIKEGSIALTKKLTPFNPQLDKTQPKVLVSQTLLNLNAGEIFGGEGLLTKSLRFNAIVTSRTCRVLCVTYKDFSFEYKRCLNSVRNLFSFRNEFLQQRVKELKVH